MNAAEYGSEQERLWAGPFGADYTARNQGAPQMAANVALFASILRRTGRINSVIEFGANIGLNLDAIRILAPVAEQCAIEIHPDAADACQAKGRTVHQMPIQHFCPTRRYDLAFTKGVLIHINPMDLPEVYEKLYAASARWLMVAEYYNPQPYTVSYRGHENALYKRDFAGEMLDRFPDLRLVDYGFVYRRDLFKQDDLSWFLMEKPR